MLIRPLIGRELLRESRRGMHFLWRVLFVCCLGGLVAWRGFGFRATSYRSAQAVMARYGTELFMIWAMAQFVAVCLFTTVRAAALADERRSGSLPLMQTTSLGDKGIILGWFLSAMGRAVFTMVLALPVLVMSRGFGGFTLDQVGAVCFVTLLAAAHAAAFTLMLAALSASAGAAVAWSIILQAAAMSAAVFIIVELRLRAEWLQSLAILYEAVRARPFSVVTWLLFSFPRALLTGVYLLLAIRFLKRGPLRLGRPLKRLLVAADGYFLRLARNRMVLWRPGLGPCKGNPVLWRERAVSVLGQRDHMIRLFYWPLLGVIVVGGIGGMVGGVDFMVHVMPAAVVGAPLLVCAVLLVVPPAGTFARERQQRTLPLMAATPLTARRIVLGKYWASLRPAWLPLAVAGIFGCLIALYESRESAYLVLAAVGFAPLLVAQILYVCAGARSTTFGIAAAAGLAFGWVVVWFWRDWFPVSGRSYLLRLPTRGGPAGPDLVTCAAVTAFAVGAAILAKRMRLTTNAAFLASCIFLILLASKFFGPWGGVAVVPVVALLLVALSARGSAHPFRSVVRAGIGLLVVLTGVFCLAVADATLAMFVMFAALLALVWRAARYAGPGLINRLGLALAAPCMIRDVCCWVSIVRRSPRLMSVRRLEVASLLADAHSPTLLVVMAIVMTIVFLSVTIGQLDGLMERNG